MKVVAINGANLNLLGTREPHIYGSTTLADVEASLRAQAEKLGIDARVDFLGDQEYIADLLPAADVFLLPSQHESFGLAALEAMSCGIPVLGSRIGGLPEVIEHGETEICKRYSGLDEDLFVTADAEAFVEWHTGRLTWAAATGERRSQLHGPSRLVRDFPTWNARSMFADIAPASRTSASGG